MSERRLPWKDPQPGVHELFGVEFHPVGTAETAPSWTWCKCGWHSDKVRGKTAALAAFDLHVKDSDDPT